MQEVVQLAHREHQAQQIRDNRYFKGLEAGPELKYQDKQDHFVKYMKTVEIQRSHTCLATEEVETSKADDFFTSTFAVKLGRRSCKTRCAFKGNWRTLRWVRN